VRSRHRQDEHHVEVIIGKVIDAQGSRSRFAFARNSLTIASSAFKQALAVAGVTADTPEEYFRHRCRDFRPANANEPISSAA